VGPLATNRSSGDLPVDYASCGPLSLMDPQSIGKIDNHFDSQADGSTAKAPDEGGKWESEFPKVYSAVDAG
jgi:hypothetical protein